jgi:DnaJ like chaperone protein
MIFGKIVAGLLGLLLFGLWGVLPGLLIGHWFDRGLQHSLGFASPEHLARVRESFFKTSFLLLGLVAKVDGRVSEAEVAHTEDIIRQLGLGEEQRQAAIRLFKQGAAKDFQPRPVVSGFNELCRGQKQLQQTLLVFLVSLALADGQLDVAEQQALEMVAGYMGFSASDFARLVRMIEAQRHFHGSAADAIPEKDQLKDAYLALGVDPDAGDREVKKAYRRLMSQNHPDKLIARGVPEEMVKMATEQSQEILAAYELIKKSRGSR